MLYASANRDEAVFGPTADRFDVSRDPNPHVAFGFGPHFCIGAVLARLEGRILLEELLARFGSVEVGRTGGADRLTGHRRRAFGPPRVRAGLTQGWDQRGHRGIRRTAGAGIRISSELSHRCYRMRGDRPGLQGLKPGQNPGLRPEVGEVPSCWNVAQLLQFGNDLCRLSRAPQ